MRDNLLSMTIDATASSAGKNDDTVQNQEQNSSQKTPASNEGQGGTPKTFTQEEVNALLATEKRNAREKMDRLRAAGVSDEEIEILNKREEANAAENTLKTVQQERVKLLLEKHSGVIAKLAPEQIQKLKESNPDRVEEFLTNLSAVVGSNAASTTQTPPEGGELPPMASGTPPANISKEDLAMAEGIERGLKTDDWSGVVNGLFGKI